MKKILTALALLAALGANAELVFRQSNAHPQTGTVTTFAFESTAVYLSGNIARTEIQGFNYNGPTTIYVRNCEVNSKGGEYSVLPPRNLPIWHDFWVAQGARLIDSISLAICHHALKKEGLI